jgi:transcriptional regulator with XRE-family HTH domain
MNSKEFGKYIRKCWEEAGFESREALARASGISAPTLFRIENGKTREPGIETLKKLAKTLNLDEEDLMRKAGYLPENVKQEDLSGYVSAIEDFSDNLSPEGVKQFEQYKHYLKKNAIKLSTNEQKLLVLYRKLTSQSQETALVIMTSLVENDRVKIEQMTGEVKEVK